MYERYSSNEPLHCLFCHFSIEALDEEGPGAVDGH